MPKYAPQALADGNITEADMDIVLKVLHTLTPTLTPPTRLSHAVCDGSPECAVHTRPVVAVSPAAPLPRAHSPGPLRPRRPAADHRARPGPDGSSVNTTSNKFLSATNLIYIYIYLCCLYACECM